MRAESTRRNRNRPLLRKPLLEKRTALQSAALRPDGYRARHRSGPLPPPPEAFARLGESRRPDSHLPGPLARCFGPHAARMPGYDPFVQTRRIPHAESTRLLCIAEAKAMHGHLVVRRRVTPEQAISSREWPDYFSSLIRGQILCVRTLDLVLLQFAIQGGLPNS